MCNSERLRWGRVVDAVWGATGTVFGHAPRPTARARRVAGPAGWWIPDAGAASIDANTSATILTSETIAFCKSQWAGIGDEARVAVAEKVVVVVGKETAAVARHSKLLQRSIRSTARRLWWPEV